MMLKRDFIFYFLRTKFYFHVPSNIFVVGTQRVAVDGNSLISTGNPYYAAGSNFGAFCDQNASGYVEIKYFSSKIFLYIFLKHFL